MSIYTGMRPRLMVGKAFEGSIVWVSIKQGKADKIILWLVQNTGLRLVPNSAEWLL